MPRYDFSCEAGHHFERKAGYDATSVICECGALARRGSVYRVGIAGFASTPKGQMDFSRDFKRYDEATQQLEYQKARFEDSAQVRVPDPPLFQQAKAKADRLVKAGVKADDIST